ncbi:MAG: AAA family ATPase [Proteobacteria bacterium]|nr:AAA family ATPase [Pseudomonadota bacterium]
MAEMALNEQLVPDERRSGTVLYADLSGSTALAENRDPEEAHAVVVEALSRLERIAWSHGASLVNHRGDAIVAVFGIPRAQEDAPRAAVNAAIRMRNSLPSADGRVPLAVHIGVNSGLMVCGDVSASNRPEIDVTGDAVNVAARLCDLAPTGSILVGEETQRAAGDGFEFRAQPPAVVKGRSEPLACFELHSRQPQLHRSERRDLRAPLVGRAGPQQVLQRALDRVGRGIGGIVQLVGDAGLGKSRLLREALSWREAAGVRWLEARSLSIGAKRSFHPFGDLLRQWAGVSENDAIGSLTEAVSRLLPGEADEVATFLGALSGSPLPDPVRGDSVEAGPHQIQMSVKRWLRALAQERPLVLVFEDLHWADRSSLELLESLANLVVGEPLLLLLAYRPERPEVDEFGARLGEAYPVKSERIDLAPLDAEASEALVQHLVGAGQIPPSARELVCQRAAGNPLFVEEQLRALVAGGFLERRADGLWARERIQSVDVPDRIRDVILCRLDRLSPAAKDVLQVASVVGPRLPEDFLRGRFSEAERGAALDELVDLQLLVPASAGAWTFYHPLVAEVVYEALPLSRRRALHGQVAQSLPTSGATGQAALLAYHHTRAGQPREAERYLQQAGEEAAKTLAPSEALDFFRSAYAAYVEQSAGLREPEKLAALERDIGLAHFQRGQMLDAVDYFNRYLEHMGERVPRRRIEMLAGFVRTLVGLLARPYLPRASRPRPEPTPRDREIISIMFKRALAQTTAHTAAYLFHGLDTLRKLESMDPRTLANAGGMYAGAIAMFSFSGVSFSLAERFRERAEPLVDDGDARERVLFGFMRFFHLMLLGDWGAHYSVPDEVVREALRRGALWDVSNYLGFRGKRDVHQGRFAEARQALLWLAEIQDLYGYDLARQNLLAVGTLECLERRDLAQARRIVATYATSLDEDHPRIFALGIQAKVLLLSGDRAGAAAALHRAEELVRQVGIVPPFQLSTLATAQLLAAVLELEEAVASNGASLRRRAGRRARLQARRAIAVARKVASQRTEVHRLAGWVKVLPRDRSRRSLRRDRRPRRPDAHGRGGGLRRPPALRRTSRSPADPAAPPSHRGDDAVGAGPSQAAQRHPDAGGQRLLGAARVPGQAPGRARGAATVKPRTTAPASR